MSLGSWIRLCGSDGAAALELVGHIHLLNEIKKGRDSNPPPCVAKTLLLGCLEGLFLRFGGRLCDVALGCGLVVVQHLGGLFG